MAEITELIVPSNVTLCRGAMQNWRDLVKAGPAWTPPILALLDSGPAPTSAIVVGPHPPSLVADLVARKIATTVIVRAIPDAAQISEVAPDATIVCGDLLDAAGLVEPADLVIALDDVTRIISAEEPSRRWAEVVASLLALRSAQGCLWLAVENDRGLHRLRSIPAPATTTWDADWSPLAGWDETRPRSIDQLTAALPDVSGVWSLQADWARPRALGSLPSTPASRAWLAALAQTPGEGDQPTSAHVVGLRTSALADSLDADASGWLVTIGGPAPTPQQCSTLAGVGSEWTVTDTDAIDATGRRVPIPAHGRTLLRHLVTLCINNDLAAVRQSLQQWSTWAATLSPADTLPAVSSDLRFGNIAFADDASMSVIVAASGPVGLDAARWSALTDFVTTLKIQGIRHPWPNAQTWDQVLDMLAAMAGLALDSAPDNARTLATAPVLDQGQSRDELLAVTARQDAQIRALTSRLKWTEREYVAHRAIEAGKRRAKKATSLVRRAVGKGRRTVGKITKQIGGSP